MPEDDLVDGHSSFSGNCHLIPFNFLLDSFGWPQPGCRFPSWFTHTSWQDLAARHVYVPDEVGETIRVTYRHSTHSRGHERFAFRCVRPDHENSTETSFIAVSYSSNEWLVL